MLLFDKVKEKKKYIFFIIIISLFVGIVVSINISKKEYVSTSTLLLIRTENTENNKIQKVGNLELSDKLISTFEEILKSDENLSKSKQDANISNNEFKNKISLKRIKNSDTFKIQVKNQDENIAKNQNQKLLDNFSGEIKELYSNIEVNIIDNPHIEKYSYNINIILPIFVSILIGIIIGLIYITTLIIIEKNKKIYSKIEKELNLRKLGEIPLKINKKDKTNKNELIAYESEKSKLSKAFKNLRSNIQFINVNNNGKNTFLITSPLKLEGKSFVTANIAISFAEAGKKVILIDSDMINGRQSEIFNVPNNLGFSNYLSRLDSNGMEIQKLTNNFIRETTIKNLNLITSGTVPPNPTELLSSDNLNQLIKDLSVFYDMVIIDGTPILTTTDALILARKVNSTIIVSNYKKTKIEDLLKTKKDVQNIGGRPIGIIVNKIKIRKSKKEIKDDLEKLKLRIKKDFRNILNKLNQIKQNSKQKLLEEAKIKENNKDIIIEKEFENQIINELPQINNEIKLEEIKINKLEEKIDNIIDNIKEDNTKKSNIKNRSIKKISKEIFSKVKFNKEEAQEKENLENVKLVEESKLSENKNLEENNLQVNSEINIENNYLEIPEIENSQKEASVVEEKNEKLKVLKNKALEIYSFLKEKVSFNSVKLIIEKYKEKNKTKNEKIISDNLEKNNEETSKEVEINKKNKNTKRKTEKENNKKSENSILVIVDAENAYCRIFSEHCFVEKIIKGIDKVDGFEKDQYSIKLVTSRKEGIMNVYNLNKTQVKRIDPLIYITLCDYDDTVWLERKMISNKAENYVLTMAKEYEKLSEETEQEYEIRTKRLRKQALKKLEIEIEYKLNNLWKTMQISITDKIMLNYFYRLYDLKKDLKTEEELNNHLENIKFYNEIILKAENRLKKISNEDQKKVKKDENMEIEKINEEALRKEEEKQRLIEEKNRKKEEKKQKKQERRKQLAQKKQEKIKEQEELKKQKEEEKERQKEEARIEEELLGDNLYPKTKNNRNI